MINFTVNGQANLVLKNLEYIQVEIKEAQSATEVVFEFQKYAHKAYINTVQEGNTITVIGKNIPQQSNDNLNSVTGITIGDTYTDSKKINEGITIPEKVILNIFVPTRTNLKIQESNGITIPEKVILNIFVPTGTNLKIQESNVVADLGVLIGDVFINNTDCDVNIWNAKGELNIEIKGKSKAFIKGNFSLVSVITHDLSIVDLTGTVTKLFQMQISQFSEILHHGKVLVVINKFGLGRFILF